MRVTISLGGQSKMKDSGALPGITNRQGWKKKGVKGNENGVDDLKSVCYIPESVKKEKITTRGLGSAWIKERSGLEQKK